MIFAATGPVIWTTELMMRVFVRSPVFRHDAAQSARAAFTGAELQKTGGARWTKIFSNQSASRKLPHGT